MGDSSKSRDSESSLEEGDYRPLPIRHWNFTWIIEDFYKTSSEELYSEVFTLSSDVRLRLALSENGEDESGIRGCIYISEYYPFDDDSHHGETEQAKRGKFVFCYKMSALGPRDECMKFVKGKFRSGEYCSEYLCIGMLLYSGLIVNGSIKILCELTAFQEDEEEELPLGLRLLSEDMEMLYLNPKSSDLTLLCGDEVFRVHESVLRARSPAFADRLEKDRCDKVRIVDVDSESLKELLRYIYCGKLREIPLGLYEAATKYGLKYLGQQLVPAKITSRTSCKLSETQFVWVIDHFSSLEEQTIKSPLFQTCSGKKWIFSLLNSESIRIVGTFIDWWTYIAMHFTLSVSLVDADGKDTFTSGACDETYFWESNDGVMLHVERSKLIEGKFLNEDALTIKIDINEFIYTHHYETCKFSAHCSVQETDDLTVLSQDFQKLLETKKYADSFLLMNAEQIPVHKAIVCSRSCVFEGLEEKETNLFASEDKETIYSLLYYLYAGKVNRSSPQAIQKLIEMGDAYKIKGLKTLCQEIQKPEESSGNQSLPLSGGNDERTQQTIS